MSSAGEHGAFHALEHEGWQSVADAYDARFRPLTTQTIDPLLDAVGARPGVELLDVASGPGYVAAAAAARRARVVGIDFSAPMVAMARRRHPGIEFREGDAEALPIADGSVDAVVMSFGLLHLERPDQAIREAHRVLRSGGRFAFTVWAGPDEAVGLGIVLRAVRTHGNPDVPLPPGPPFFRFSDPSECERSLRAAGFEAPHVAKVPQVWRLSSGEVLFETMQEATVRTSALLRAQSPEALRAIRAAVIREGETWRRGAGLELPMPAVLASATRGA